MHYFIYGLQFLFITLKLVGIISWSWWLVLLPLIIIVLINLFVICTTAYFYSKASPLEKTLFDIQRGKFK
jgi:hypothetical protein